MDKKILNKYISGDASQNEKEAVQLWLEANTNNRKEYMALRMLYDITLGNLPEDKSEREIRLRNKRKNFFFDLIKIAATVLITLSFSHYLLQGNFFTDSLVKPSMQTLYIPSGQRAELTLVDGTIVFLNSLTTFRFPENFSGTSREVYLDGEGYFKVAHDDNKLFNVNTDQYVVKVLGTEFNVLSYSRDNSFETALISGSVEISAKKNQQKTLLTPNFLAYVENNQLKTTTISNYNYFLWKDGIISIEHERIEDILKKLEIYYDIRIENHNRNILNIRYTGKFRTKHGIEHVLKVLQVATGFQFKKDEEKNLIHIY